MVCISPAVHKIKKGITHCNCIKENYDDKVKLLSDTDSLANQIETIDMYEDFCLNK